MSIPYEGYSINLVRMRSFWNNLHRVRSKSKSWQAK